MAASGYRVIIDPADQPGVDAALAWVVATSRYVDQLEVGESTGLEEETYGLLLACIDRFENLEALDAIGADPGDMAAMHVQGIKLAVMAHGMHKRVTEPSDLAGTGMSEDEFRAKWIVPMEREATVVAHRSERRYLARLRAPRVVRSRAGARPRARRRHADRRAAGLRSGTDPGDGDPEPQPHPSAAANSPADAPVGGNLTDRPLLVLGERHPVHGLVDRPLARFLAGRR